MSGEPRVLVVVGSRNDLPRLEEARAVLGWFGVEHEERVASAHRSPREVLDLGSGARGRGILAIVAVAGKAAALPGVLAASTTLPVIGVPLSGQDLGGLDALLSTVQMPRGVPVASVAIDGVANAAILAVQLCALADPSLVDRLDDFKRALSEGADVLGLVGGSHSPAQEGGLASRSRSGDGGSRSPAQERGLASRSRSGDGESIDEALP